MADAAAAATADTRKMEAREKGIWEKAEEEEGHMSSEFKGLALAKSKLPPSRTRKKPIRKEPILEYVSRRRWAVPSTTAQDAAASKDKQTQVVIHQPSKPTTAQDAAASKDKQTQVVIHQPSKPAFAEDALAAFRARRKKERESESDESRTDKNAYEARLYRKFWYDNYAAEEHASYEDTTPIPPMCFTDSTDPNCTFISMQPTLQVFSIKIEEVAGGLDWPLDVYGVVAVRDVVDHKRNVIFYRQRDNCQTINSEDPYLALTGPTRAVVVTVHPTYFEVDLKVKGAVESEDKDLSLLAVCYTSNGPSRSCVLTRVATSKLSTVKLTFGHILGSVEATVSIEILGGEWTKEYQKGIFTASTESLKGRDICLLSFGDGKLPVEDGQVMLSRRVVSVELLPLEEEKLRAKLMVCLKAVHVSDKNGKVEQHLSFKPKSRGRSYRIIKVGSCEMQVTVAWSLLSTFRCSYEKVMSAGVA